MSGPKKAQKKNGTLTWETLEATDLVHCMHTQLDFRSNIGGILKWQYAQKKTKNFWIKFGPKELDLQAHFNIYFGS